MGIGRTRPLREPALVDDIVAVSTDDAESMARLGPGARVVTLVVDSGLKYLSTDGYRSR